MLVGLTGGIGSGKSAAGNFFIELGIDVVDADDLSRAAIAEGTHGSELIRERFGNDILDHSQQIDRKKLRKVIFENPEEKQFVESIIHPEVANAMTVFIKSAQSPYKIVIVPLLFETDSQNMYDRVLFIDTSEELQITRASARDGVDEANIKAIIGNQLPRNEKLKLADDIIVNNAGLDKLMQSVNQTHNFYLSLCNE
jgi:dephospho-CoA kinase